MMQAIIHSVAVVGLTDDPDRLGLGPGDPLALSPETEGGIAVMAHARPAGPLGRLRRARWITLGHLGPTARGLVAPILTRGGHLRVRVVNATSARLGGPEIRLSVWADADEGRAAQAAHRTGTAG
ncbi:hypothetical protein [Rhodovulum adriaticum]|uniref:Uncharacterized protein n=2 Tax=Rhodovulum adriaticum TaxID=35804 RepID=A0A4R2NKV2_RHOAD|nr:hypothetical protein [Rhodovulum adriaticum]TCP21814.1 hypothetical protein EV656_10966 [Rhodovulum adriaticum]